jgi:hypothetical protein
MCIVAYFNINIVMPAITAASGKVITHDSTILESARLSMVPVTRPTPEMEPTDTCVVDTGKPSLLAKITRNAVITFAANPWLGVRGTMFLLIVTATLRALSQPPTAIVNAMIENVAEMPVYFAASSSATSLGVSFTPRAKQMLAALR